MPTPSNTDTTKAPTAGPQPRNLGELTACNCTEALSVCRAPSAHADRPVDGVGGGADAVAGAPPWRSWPSSRALSRILQASCRSRSWHGSPPLPTTQRCPEPFRHADDRRSSALAMRRLACVSAVRVATYSGGRATAATSGGLRASAALTAGRGVLGRTGVSEVCDANPYLLRAAKFHGETEPVMCPICRKEQLTLVSWVFGDHLGAVSARRARPKSWSC